MPWLPSRSVRREHRIGGGASIAAQVTVGVAATVLWAVLGLVRQRTLRTGIDLGLYTQAVAGYARGTLPWSSLKTADGRFDLLGDHFTPVVALIAPAYRIWPHPSTLIVAQAVLIGTGTAVFTGTACRVLGSGLAAVTTGLALTVSWGMAGLALFDFHEVAFAVPLVAAVVDRAVADRFRAAVAWCLPLLLVKEDSAFLLAGVGLTCWVAGQRRLGVAAVSAAAAAWWLTVGIVIPALSWSGRYTYWAVLGAGGANPGAEVGRVALAVDSRPGLTVLTLVATCSLGLVFRSPLGWATIPPLLARFATANPGYWGPGHHYDATITVIAFGAALDAVHRGWWRLWRPRLSRAVPAALLLASLATAWNSPLRGAAQPSFYRCPRCTDARVAVDLIPDGADVAADTFLVDQLVDRATVRLLVPGLTDSVGRPLFPQWVVIDRQSRTFADPRAVDAVIALAAGRGCQTRHDEGGYVVMRCPET